MTRDGRYSISSYSARWSFDNPTGIPGMRVCFPRRRVSANSKAVAQ